MLNVAEILTPTIYPVVGAKLVRLLGLQDAEADRAHAIQNSINAFKAQHDKALIARNDALKANDLAAHTEADRRVKRLNFQIRKNKKQLADIMEGKSC